MVEKLLQLLNDNDESLVGKSPKICVKDHGHYIWVVYTIELNVIVGAGVRFQQNHQQYLQASCRPQTQTLNHAAFHFWNIKRFCKQSLSALLKAYNAEHKCGYIHLFYVYIYIRMCISFRSPFCVFALSPRL